jgi:hypothetical protein
MLGINDATRGKHFYILPSRPSPLKVRQSLETKPIKKLDKSPVYIDL